MPAEAVTRRDGRAQVTVVKGPNQTEERAVETGISDGVVTEVVSGLTDGETVRYTKAVAAKSPSSFGGPGAAARPRRCEAGCPSDTRVLTGQSVMFRARSTSECTVLYKKTHHMPVWQLRAESGVR